MDTRSFKKIVLLFIIPTIFLIYYLSLLYLNNFSINETIYIGLSGSELIIVGIVAIFELSTEMYFSRQNITDKTKLSLLDKEYLYNQIMLIVTVIFYAMLKYIGTEEIVSLNSEKGPSEEFKFVLYSSLSLGIMTVLWGIRTINKLKKII